MKKGPEHERYDAIIIGAGMSGMAAAIRLAMFDNKVCILERHRIPGGLNSYYQRGKRQLDVGLHAMTNFVKKGEKRKPLTKLLKQLRIPYDQFKLQEQSYSVIQFPGKQLKFTNESHTFLEEIDNKFPDQVEGFKKLTEHIESFNEVSLDNPYQPARQVVETFLTDPQLIDMIFCPLLIYGSAWEEDMDFSQFAIMFKSIFLEGFSRPSGGVRTIIDLLNSKLEELNVEICYGHGVKSIITEDGNAVGLITDQGKTLKSPKIFSSAGIVETQKMINEVAPKEQAREGKMSFTESIIYTKDLPLKFGQEATIIFYNERDRYHYRRPKELFDPKSAVICMPNAYDQSEFSEGVFRVTHMANYEKWRALDKSTYKQEKEKVSARARELLKQYVGDTEILFQDTFTPTTVEKYTGHTNGAVYGSIDKSRDGRTEFEGLYIMGTDQGFLGIVGAMLSGISMANYHGLQQ